MSAAWVENLEPEQVIRFLGRLHEFTPEERTALQTRGFLLGLYDNDDQADGVK